MSLLTAAVVLVGVLCLVSLLLTFGVIRRLREGVSSPPRPRVAPPREAVVQVGSTPDAFHVTAIDGTWVTRESLAEWAIFAFTAPDCRSCVAKLPQLVADLRALPGDEHDVVAVVVGDAGAAASMVTMLKPVARVVVEQVDGPVAEAFRVRQMPVMCRLDNRGVVIATGYDVDGLLVPAAT